MFAMTFGLYHSSTNHYLLGQTFSITCSIDYIKYLSQLTPPNDTLLSTIAMHLEGSSKFILTFELSFLSNIFGV